MASTRPLISVVTPSFNQGHYIEATVWSVLEQDYPHLEYIVVDGGSTDQTLDILRRYEDRLSWSSQPDQGQADAINKGFAQANGEIMGWLNSDDIYAPGALRAVATYFEQHPDAMFVYGDAIGIDRTGKQYGVRQHIRQRQRYPDSDFDVLLQRYDFIVQPASFWRRTLWRDVGALNLHLRYSMDYEYWMRVAKQYSLDYLPVTLAYERLYGEAKTGSGTIERLDEIEQVALRQGGSGIPAHYRAEAAAHYAARGVQHALRGKFEAMNADFAASRALQAPFPSFARYLLVMLLFGSQAIPNAWLWLNRWRTRRGWRWRR